MKLQKNVLWALSLAAATLIGFASCSDDDDNKGTDPVVEESVGAYILNSGSYTNNNPAFVYYDMTTKSVTNAFRSANGIDLGDTAQDAVIYGSKKYIGMYGSGLIYVLDTNNKIISTIKAADGEDKLQPRAFETYNGKVYVTLYDGYLARIDTTSLTIDKRIAVGPNPESVKFVNNKFYVANSGGFVPGYNNTLSIVDVDLNSQREIEVGLNPCELKVDKNKDLYVIARGNYGYGDPDVPGVVQHVDLSTDKATTIFSGRAYSVYPIDNKLYILDKPYVDNKPVSTVTYYDLSTKKLVDQSFITDGTAIADISYITKEEASGDFYVLAANGTNSGDCYIFSSEGKLKSKFDTGAPYPVSISFVSK
ncbi:YncE family protein [Dysgonomonas macrotermitis]|uniref:40-residue YVTN family beta-propeller repeat-containing protein n=1 Tax=Dysgonomonas macrotermitis TaxID=1346286 RepID=A0A1M4YLI9_9BACT|nr:hypothetical protein [Dysgonomonas macrotermitis]SHF06497.1 hypothetical protein SAMN05444362_103206 [Dysgonomonas macrotermitis]